MPGLHILRQTLSVLVIDPIQPAQIHVVFQVGDLHAPGSGIRRRALDKRLVSLSLAFGDAVERVEKVLREAAFAEPLNGPDLTMVFHHIMQHRLRPKRPA